RNAAIIEMADRDQLGQASGAAVVVRMPVRDGEMIDGLEAGLLPRHFIDASGVAVTAVAAVDEHRFTAWRDDQRGGAAFDVSEVDVYAALLFGRESGGCNSQRCDGDEPAKFHSSSSSDDFFDWLTMIDFQPLSAGYFQLARVEAELVQHGRVQIGDVMPVLDGVEADRIGGAVGNAAFDAAAGQPDREAIRMMIA